MIYTSVIVFDSASVQHEIGNTFFVFHAAPATSPPSSFSILKEHLKNQLFQELSTFLKIFFESKFSVLYPVSRSVSKLYWHNAPMSRKKIKNT